MIAAVVPPSLVVPGLRLVVELSGRGAETTDVSERHPNHQGSEHILLDRELEISSVEHFHAFRYMSKSRSGRCDSSASECVTAYLLTADRTVAFRSRFCDDEDEDIEDYPGQLQNNVDSNSNACREGVKDGESAEMGAGGGFPFGWFVNYGGWLVNKPEFLNGPEMGISVPVSPFEPGGTEVIF